MAKAVSNKKIGRRLKKTVRRSLAAVLMLTAIGIAAIPVPEIEAATDYDYVVATSGEYVTFANTLNNSGGAPESTAYTVRKLSDGNWKYDWQFKFYNQSFSGNTLGVVSQYNSLYQQDEVTLPVNVYSNYLIITKTDYDQYFTTNNSVSKTISIDTTTVVGTATPAGDVAFFQKYFTTEYDTIQAVCTQYNTDYTAYKAKVDAGDTTAVAPTPPTTTYTHTIGELTSAQKETYYFDANLTSYGTGFKLTSVIDSIATTAAGGGNNIYNYLVSGGTPNSSYGVDENGFLVTSNAGIIAIGDNAFKGTKNVKTLILPDEIKYIGTSAFEDSFVKSVSFRSVEDIGNLAFKNCTELKTVSFEEGLIRIGAEAFYGTGIESLSLPYSVSTIGHGAFANCTSLASIDLSALSQSGSKLGNYCFHNAAKLTTINFGSSKIAGIGTACFALTTAPTGNMTEFTFPPLLELEENFGDMILAGRTNLLSVTMPSGYGSLSNEVSVPIGTFLGCINLETVTFPDNGSGSCGTVKYPNTLFKDVVKTGFYVRGPELNSSGTIALPRTSTWAANTKVSPTVPYVYNKNGVDYFEISDGKYILLANQNGELVSCELVDPTSTSDINLVIPAKVGTYDIKTVLEGCFSAAVKNNLKTLVIEDDSIATIAANVFNGCPKLESVTIGNSVTSVGANAFGNCPLLTQVYFHTPPSYSGFTIGDGAFETGASSLTFHGDIVVGYAPFEFATDPVNYVNSTTGKRICYKSNAPSNLTVILDNTNQKVTLIDYPHYETIDADNEAYCNEMQVYYTALYPTDYTATEYSIIDKYENIFMDGITPTQPWEMMSDAELQIVNSTMNLVIPAGIQSIDAKEFLNAPENASNITYLTGTVGSNGKNDVYSDNTGTTTSPGHPGLFSGYIVDYTGVNEKENSYWGNDRLLSVAMTDVEYFPDYAFESCEQLESIDIGSCTDIGTAPFSGCSSLVNITSNSKYQTVNGIIYSTNTDGSLNIVQVLSTRGDLIEPRTVSTDSDPLLANVSTIADGAFMNCDEITAVDLSGATALKAIPEYCFNNCDSLSRVILPKTVNKILDNAFTDNQKALTVTIPGKEVQITKDAFEHNQGTIRTYEDSAAFTYATIYDIDTEIIGTLYKVSFLNYDGSEIIADQYVEEGEDAEPPETDPTRTGYTFTGWSKSYKDITADTVIVALYKLNSTTSGNSTGGSGSGSGSSTTSGNSSSSTVTWYRVTVTGGSGTGYYKAGSIVSINAYATSDGKVFDKWTSTSNGVGFTNVTNASTTFTMPTNDVSIVANYKAATAIKTTATSNNTVKPSGSTSSNSTTGTKPSTGSSSGTVISITKPGFSNTGVASAIVNGSTDNYVIKVIESAQAQAEIEAALLADTETLENIKYFPMDISLYDSTGTTKINNPEGVTIDITLPIPDELIEYAGNNKVAGVVDGKLDKLKPTFKTIDGVACVTFTATHFSPYTIYVDTANLTSGTLDNSPTTGDGIHPKWFLAVGLACLSIVLFVKKDRPAISRRLA